MTKTMCEKSKEKKKKIRKMEEVFYCKNCGETAPAKKHLCNPKKL